MAMSKITYTDKVAINVDSTIPDINKCKADDLNEIKNVVNNNVDEMSNYVTFTDYATVNNSGVVYANAQSGFNVGNTGRPYPSTYTYYQYPSVLDGVFISKGTLENVISGKGLIDKNVNDLTNYTLSSDLSSVATSGSYNDLTDTPTIPNISDSYGTSTTDGYSQNYINPSLTNVSANVDTNYKTNILTTTNILDKMNVIIINANVSDTKINASENAKTLYISCLPNTTYTIQKVLSSRFRIGTTTTIPAANVDISDFNGIDTDTSKTITTSANAKYLCVYFYLDGTDTLTMQQILDSIQIVIGNETSYTPFTQNIINVNNEKYTDTINVGNEKNYKNKINILYSSNIFDFSNTTPIYKNTQTISETKITNGITIANTGTGGAFCLYKIMDATNYVGKSFTIKATSDSNLARIGIGLCSIDGSSRQLIGQEDNSNTAITITIPEITNAKYLAIWLYARNNGSVNYTNIMVNEGNEEIPYEPFMITTIYVDDKVIYSSPKVLYSEYAGNNADTITLNDDITNYSYIDIRWGVGRNESSWTRIYNSLLGITTRINYMGTISYNAFASISISGTTITFSSRSTNGWESTALKTFEVIGYK